MKDRYYILSIITSLAVLSGWLLAYDTLNPDMAFSYGDKTVLTPRLSASSEAQIISATKRQILAIRAEAESSPLGQLIELDPILIHDSQGFITTASSAAFINEKTGSLLWGERSDEQHSIASITKLFTALVFLDFNPGWNKSYQLKPEDRREGGKIYLWSGDQVTVRDLFYLSLVASGNSETLALVNSTGLGEELFVKKMNEKAKELGLEKTVFYDPIGLDERNVSTAREVAKFAREALRRPEITAAVTTAKFKAIVRGGREVVVSSTDQLLSEKDSLGGLVLNGGKTGYNEQAGYCFVGKFVNQDNRPLISVVLGEASKESRFSETMRLVDWAYANLAWPSKFDS
jgi:D-alanyl-D-alanine endopeptidase (penicillin-binding protein 7)